MSFFSRSTSKASSVFKLGTTSASKSPLPSPSPTPTNKSLVVPVRSAPVFMSRTAPVSPRLLSPRVIEVAPVEESAFKGVDEEEADKIAEEKEENIEPKEAEAEEEQENGTMESVDMTRVCEMLIQEDDRNKAIKRTLKKSGKGLKDLNAAKALRHRMVAGKKRALREVFTRKAIHRLKHKAGVARIDRECERLLMLAAYGLTWEITRKGLILKEHRNVTILDKNDVLHAANQLQLKMYSDSN